MDKSVASCMTATKILLEIMALQILVATVRH